MGHHLVRYPLTILIWDKTISYSLHRKIQLIHLHHGFHTHHMLYIDQHMELPLEIPTPMWLILQKSWIWGSILCQQKKSCPKHQHGHELRLNPCTVNPPNPRQKRENPSHMQYDCGFIHKFQWLIIISPISTWSSIFQLLWPPKI